MRATTATLLLDSSVPIESVQELLDHKHITTTQISITCMYGPCKSELEDLRVD